MSKMSNPVIRVKRGDKFELRVKLSGLSGEVAVLDETYEIRMQVRKGVNKDLIFDFSADGIITRLSELDAAGNNLIIAAAAEETRQWPAGRFLADIEVRIADDGPYTVPGADEPPLVFEVVGDITQ